MLSRVSSSGGASISPSDNDGDEQERDVLLFDLIKGLHSPRTGVQCETIVRFPRLVERYPFPVLINSAFLGLGDVFIGGSNLLRFYILKVAQQTRKHHDKITSVDEFAKRIFSVIYSNDPIARALTLRTLGNFAGIMAERKNIHHSISSGLDSHDLVELEAAIAAAKMYAERSRSFASSICQKLATTIEGLETPIDVKLKLIPIFQNMHHDAQTVATVRQVCTDLLQQYPSMEFVSITLATLSQLAAKSLMDLPEQVDLLLDCLKTDPRRVVQGEAVRNLYLLADKAPHMWTEKNILAVCDYVLTSSDDDLKLRALTVLSKLSSSVAVSKMPTDEDGAVLRVCAVCACDSHLKTALRATQILACLAVNSRHVDSGNEELFEHASTAAETLLVLCTSEVSNENIGILKMCLRCVVQLSEVKPEGADRFVDVLHSSLGFVPGEQEELLCECLCAVGSVRGDLLPALVPDLSAHLMQLSEKPKTTAEVHQRLLRYATILLQAYSESPLPADVQATIETSLGATNCWVVYRVARQATRFGHYALASKLFVSLTTKVSTEQCDFWLVALRELSRAEQRVLSGASCTVRVLSDAVVLYHKAAAALNAATTPSTPLNFQTQYVQLRTQLFQAHVQLDRACASFRTSPPPAIATSRAMSTGDEIHKYGHVVEQMKKCCTLFEQMYSKYDDLYRNSFDADPASLQHVQVLQQQCQIMSCVLHKVLARFHQSGKPKSVELGSVKGEGAMAAASTQIHKLLDALNNPLNQTPDTPPLTYKQIEAVCGASATLCGVPLCLPRYFYQALQNTSIKLALSPQPKVPNEPVTVSNDTGLTLKVEGVVVRAGRAGLFRSPRRVVVHVASTQLSHARTVSADAKTLENPTNEMCVEAEILNDYFSCQFVFAFPVPGVHKISLSTGIVDCEGLRWNADATASLTVKSVDEHAAFQQHRDMAAQRQQRQLASAAGKSGANA